MPDPIKFTVGQSVRALTGRHAGQIGTVSAAPTSDGWWKVSFDEGFGRYPARELEPAGDLPQRVRGATLTPSYIDASPAPVSVVEYSCPVAGCDYHVGAAGPIDPGEPDYHAEDVQAHILWHDSEDRASLSRPGRYDAEDAGRVHDVAEAERLAYDEPETTRIDLGWGDVSMVDIWAAIRSGESSTVDFKVMDVLDLARPPAEVAAMLRRVAEVLSGGAK